MSPTFSCTLYGRALSLEMAERVEAQLRHCDAARTLTIWPSRNLSSFTNLTDSSVRHTMIVFQRASKFNKKLAYATLLSSLSYYNLCFKYRLNYTPY